MHGLSAVAVESEGIRLVIADARLDNPTGTLARQPFLAPGFLGAPATMPASIAVAEDSQSAFLPIRIAEGTEYFWEARPADEQPVVVKTSLKNSRTGSWSERVSGPSRSGQFRVVNYLGSGWIACGPARIDFEVVPEKLDYESEFLSMVRDIADECGELLLQWESPTALLLSHDARRTPRSVLQRFMFLRDVIGLERLDLALESISRNPRTRLQSEFSWEPVGAADTSYAAAAGTAVATRSWRRYPGSSIGMAPEEILEQRQYDTFDTPENRFVLHALRTFREVCDDALMAAGASFESVRQCAYEMTNALDEAIRSPVLRDAGEMRRVPLQSQALQKRSGYRDILRWWILLDSSVGTDWAGLEDAYRADSRDVALLYEYWVYFALRNAIATVPGATERRVQVDRPGRPTIESFVTQGLRGPVVALRAGRTSVAAFDVATDISSLRAHLYYNRRFAAATDPLRGMTSYSRDFRPDYSIVVLPATYAQGALSVDEILDAERRAGDDGQLRIVHFDAKYRVQSLAEIFGEQPSPEENADSSEGQVDGQDLTYRREDLLKMHAYLDAIRMSASALVVYPGSSDQTQQFRRLQELLPGIGAVALRPGPAEEYGRGGRESLQRIVHESFELFASRYSQLYRIRYFDHDTAHSWSEPTVGAPAPPVQYRPPHDVQVAVIELASETDECRLQLPGVLLLPLLPGIVNEGVGFGELASAHVIIVLPAGEREAWQGEVAGFEILSSSAARARAQTLQLALPYSDVPIAVIAASNVEAVDAAVVQRARAWLKTPGDAKVGRAREGTAGIAAIRWGSWAQLIQRALSTSD